MLAARPGWTISAILCLAIATGANTATVTLVNGLLLRPLDGRWQPAAFDTAPAGCSWRR